MRFVSQLLMFFSIVLVGGWLGGCNVGPDYERPVTAADSVETYSWLPQQWVDANDPNLTTIQTCLLRQQRLIGHTLF
jgi:hypothetical protein